MPTNRPARLLLAIMFIVAAITVYARFRGPDCDSGTTDSYSPDLRADQLAYLDKVRNQKKKKKKKKGISIDFELFFSFCSIFLKISMTDNMPTKPC
jgi:hypothetical protein